MEEVKQLETHKNWKHVASGKLTVLIGLAVYKGGVNDSVGDMADVIVVRPKNCDGWADLDVVPGHYTVTDVKTGDAARMQTAQPVMYGDRLAVYMHGDDVWVRPYAEFLDGRFVKTDEQGHELGKVDEPTTRWSDNSEG